MVSMWRRCHRAAPGGSGSPAPPRGGAAGLRGPGPGPAAVLSVL